MVEASLKKLTVGAVSAVFSMLLVGATPAEAETINFLNVGNASTSNLASGVFQGLNDFGAGVFTQARSYLSALFQGQTIGSSSFNSALYFTSTATWLDSVGRNGVQGQDQITQVPEPGTLLLMGLGGVALFRNRRRQARS